MIIVDKALQEREKEGRPVRVALVGAGFMGRGIALQILSAMAGMRLVAISNPTAAVSYTYVGNVLNFAGRPAESLARMAQVTCATALHTHSPFCFSVLGHGYYLTERYEEAIAAYDQVLRHKRSPLFKETGHLGLAACYSELGRAEEAKAEIAAVLNINPQFSLVGIQQRWPYQDPADLERFLTALRNAGLK